MLNIIKIILFIIVNVAGWFSVQVIALLAIKYSVFPQLPPLDMELLKWWYFTVGIWVWMACALVSIGYFFTLNELKNWLLLAPMYGTALYCVSTLVYFQYFYTIH